MMVRIHPHALARMAERGAAEAEVIETVQRGETFPAKFGRSGFRLNFAYNEEWRGRTCATKQIEAVAVPQGEGWLVVTVIVKYF